MGAFKDYACYYDLIYSEKNYELEAKTVDLLIKKNSENVVKILNLGCGTGRHDYEMNRLGYTIKGVDLSPQMIEIAKVKYSDSINLEFCVGNAQSFCDNKIYDCILSLFHVMSYQNTNDEVMAVMNTAYRELEEGGLFIFDAWYGPGVLNERPENRIKRVESDRYEVVRYATPIMHENECVVDVKYDISVMDKLFNQNSDFSEIHKMRYFFLPEIELCLNLCGFELVDSVDSNSLCRPGFDSWTVYFIARKR